MGGEEEGGVIDWVRVRNFRSHEDTELSLHPGVNAILGDNDSGKSALLAALRWLVENRPLGESHRSRWGGDTSVAASLDGRVVERRRGGGDNAYELDGRPLEGFGQGVPDAVVEAFGIDPVSVQRQADPPFLIGLAPGEAARVLNRAAGLDDAAGATAWLASAQRSADREAASCAEELGKAREQLERYADLGDMEAAVEIAEELELELERVDLDRRALLALLDLLDGSRKRAGKTAVPEELEAALEAAAEIHAELELARKGMGLLGRAAEAVSSSRERAEGARAAMERAEERWAKEAPDRCPLCGAPMLEGTLAPLR